MRVLLGIRLRRERERKRKRRVSPLGLNFNIKPSTSVWRWKWIIQSHRGFFLDLNTVRSLLFLETRPATRPAVWRKKRECSFSFGVLSRSHLSRQTPHDFALVRSASIRDATRIPLFLLFLFYPVRYCTRVCPWITSERGTSGLRVSRGRARIGRTRQPGLGSFNVGSAAVSWGWGGKERDGKKGKFNTGLAKWRLKEGGGRQRLRKTREVAITDANSIL